MATFKAWTPDAVTRISDSGLSETLMELAIFFGDRLPETGESRIVGVKGESFLKCASGSILDVLRSRKI